VYYSNPLEMISTALLIASNSPARRCCPSIGCVLQVPFGIRRRLKRLRLVRRGLRDLSRKVLHHHVEGGLAMNFRPLQLGALSDELVQQFLQQLEDAMRLELVAVKRTRLRLAPPW